MHQFTWLLPIVFRIGVLVAPPTFHFFFHKIVHASIHMSSHRVHAFGVLTKRFKFLPDVLMVVALVALHLLTEKPE